MFKFKLSFLATMAALLFSLAGCSKTNSTADSSTDGSETEDDATSSSTALNPVDFIGDWTGSWNNTTYSSTGAAKMTIAYDLTTKKVTLDLDLDGNVFGASNPAKETFTADYVAGQPLVFTKSNSAMFGNLTLTFSTTGSITGSGTNVPAANIDKVTFQGTSTKSSVNMTYEVTFEDSTPKASGTITLTK